LYTPKLKAVGTDSETIVYQRFERDLAQVQSFYKLEDATEVDYQRASDIMLQMGFLTEKSTIDKSVVFAKLWDEMSAPKDATTPEDKKTTVRMLKVYMCAIQNFIFPWITEA
jgi:hypothetical protein